MNSKTLKAVVFRVKFTIVILVLFVVLYGSWFMYPYIAFANTYGFFKVLFYPTTAFVSADKNESVSGVLLGISGDRRDGSLLTDTITLISFNLKTKKIITVAIPRDIWSADMKDKINAAYAYGVRDENALKWLAPEVEKITGFAPSYYAIVDFEKFKLLIDKINGIDINVERSFMDKNFPVPGREEDLCDGDPELRCRYKTVSFAKGFTHMNGETALIYARSRYSEDLAEGTDFAREHRQEAITQAILRKVTSPAFVLGRSAFISFMEYTDTLFEKNISLTSLFALSRTYFFNRVGTKSYRIRFEENHFNVPPYEEYEGRYVLVPKDGFDNLREYVKKQSMK